MHLSPVARLEMWSTWSRLRHRTCFRLSCLSFSSIFVLARSIPAIAVGLTDSLGLVWWGKVGGVAGGNELLGKEKFEGRGGKKKKEKKGDSDRRSSKQYSGTLSSHRLCDAIDWN